MTVSLVQSAHININTGPNLIQTNPVTAGNILIMTTAQRNNHTSDPTVNDSFGRQTTFTDFGSEITPQSTDWMRVAWSVAQGDEQTLHQGNDDPGLIIYEVSGITADDCINATVLRLTNQSASSTKSLGSLISGTNHIAFMGLITSLDGTTNEVPATGWTEDYEGGSTASLNGHAWTEFAHAIGQTGNLAATYTGGASVTWAAMAVDILGISNVCNPRIIDNMQRIISITSEFESYDRSSSGPTWVADNVIPAGASGSPPVIVQQNSGYITTGGNVNFGSVPTSGHILILIGGRRGGTIGDPQLNNNLGAGVPFTNFATPPEASVALHETVRIAYRVSNGTEQNLNFNANDVFVVIYEVSGISAADCATAAILNLTAQGGSFTRTLGTLTGGPNNIAFMGTVTEQDFSAVNGMTPSAGWTEDYERGAGSSADLHPHLEIAHAIGQSSLLAETVDSNSNREWGGIAVDIGGSGSTSIYSVDGMEAYLDIDLVHDNANSHVETLPVPFAVWMIDNQEFSVRFRVDSVPNGSAGHHYVGMEFSITGPTVGPIVAKARISSSGTYGQIVLGGSTAAKTDWIADSWYTMSILRTDTQAKVKMWADSETEPTSYAVTLTADYSWALGVDAVFGLTVDWTQITAYTSPSRIKFYWDDLMAGCVETAPITPPTPTFGTYTRDRMVLSIRASFTDDNLYNHALVIATGDKNHVYVSEVKDTDSGSPTRIANIGDRVFKYETDQISTQAAADKAARKVFLDNCLVSEDIDLEAICNPAFEGNDVIAVEELTFSELNKKFRIRALTVPLSTSRQVFKLSRVIAL